MGDGGMRPAVGETWRHAASGGLYRVERVGFDAARDEDVVVYVPADEQTRQRCRPHHTFVRPLTGHPKSWLSTVEDGTPRFQKAGV